MNAHPLRADSGEQPEKGGGNVGPIRYQISVRGRLSERLGSAFAGMIMEPGAGQTVLLGEIRDQSHLYGILDRVRSLGLELVSVRAAVGRGDVGGDGPAGVLHPADGPERGGPGRPDPGHPARYVELPRARRPFAVVWTKRRVAEWERTGERPAVAVWTPEQLSAFLASVAGHPLFALFRLVGMRGLRRGEACGLRWSDLDLDDGLAYISRQLQEDARGRLTECPLKTESSRRAVALGTETVIILRAHRSRQRARLGEAAVAPGAWVFTREDGGPLSPEVLTCTFVALVGQTDLPPVRLHDLRHGAATLMLLAGMELKTIADQLGHSSVVLTADTYVSVAVELGLKSAEAAARLVLKAGSRPPNGGRARRRTAPMLAEVTA